MTTPMGLASPPSRLPVLLRIQAMVAVGAARLLARQPPAKIRSVLTKVCRGAAPSSQAQALKALNAVNSVSARCRSPRGCVPRSIATVLLCRAWGGWPTWVVGVRRIGPFSAHAWVEVEGAVVGESYPDDYFLPMIVVPVQSTEGPDSGGRPVTHSAVRGYS
jgi:Transglutaminase-like superfamily